MTRSRPVAKPAPPVAQRPRCPQCRKPLAPYMTGAEHVRGTGLPDDNGVRSRTLYTPASWDGTYKGYGAFCTLRCGTVFGQRAYDAGYR